MQNRTTNHRHPDPADDPIPYVVTTAGWALPAPPATTCSLPEAARRRGVTKSRIQQMCVTGKVAARKLDGRWCIDVVSLDASAPADRVPFTPRVPQGPVLPAAPLLRQVWLRGGSLAAGAQPNSAEEKALERAELDGWVSLTAADHLVVTLLRMTPWELWGRDWDREVTA